MNSTAIQDILTTRFQGFTQITETLYRVEDRVNTRIASIQMFDASAVVAQTGFNFQRFQEEIIRNEYHRVSGSLQWNLYFYLLCDDDDYSRILANGTVDLIESDKLYARKFVRSVDQLRKEFEKRKHHTASIASLPADIAGVWTEKCEKASMSVLTSALSYAEIARRIETGNTKCEQESEPQQTVPNRCTAAAVIKGVAQLRSDRFRPKIDGREFKFGNVNLICGPNGAGKTSVLQAIELWMCGRTFRNRGPEYSNAVLDIMLKNSTSYERGPAEERSVYRLREMQWYSAHQKRTDSLPVSFSRFNFFDADAAARLELAPDDLAINTALQDIVLGEESARLRKQFDAVLPLLIRRHKECSSEFESAVQQRTNAQNSIDTIQRPTDDLSSAIRNISDKLREIQWSDPTVSNDSDQIASLVSNLIDAQTTCSSVTSDSCCGQGASAESISSAITICVSIEERADAISKKMREYDKQLIGHRSRHGQIETRMRALTRVVEYLKAGAGQLWGYEDKLTEARHRHSLVSRAVNIINSVSLDSLSSMAGNVCSCAEALSSKRNEAKLAYAEALNMLKGAKEHISKVEALAAQALEASRQYVKADNSAHFCPTCLADYTREELVRRVLSVRATSSADLLAPHYQAVNGTKVALEEAEKLLSVMHSLRTAAEAIRPSDEVAKLSLQVLLEETKKWKDMESQAATAILAIQSDFDRLKCLGYSSEELHQLVTIVDRVTDFESVVDLNSAEAWLSEEEVKQKVEQDGMSKCLKDKSVLESNLSDIRSECEKLNITLTNVKERIAQLRIAQDHVEHLKKWVEFSNNMSIINIELGLKSVLSLVNAYRVLSHECNSVEQTLENLREQIAKADVTISRVRPLIEKLKLGIDFVQQITVEADPEKALSEFLCGTKREIGELFSAIHSPQEFESVEVDSGGSLCAKRKRDGNLCSVSEMSSGQRSALGISLFLVMNRLATKAPRIILMDDPMAHVDDLNALAFFDCLREITANGSRQLFFATASGKAAALFCKKFDFMGNDFVIHKLTS